MSTTNLDDQQPCSRCGFAPAHVSPADAAVAVRSLARRWRELIAAIVAGDDDGEDLLRLRLNAGWSALDHLCHVVKQFEGYAEMLEQVRVQHRPVVAGVRPPRIGLSTEELMSQLDSAAERLAQVIGRYHGEQWGRVGIRDGQEVDALRLAREAVHVGSHHLRVCRSEVRELFDPALGGVEPER